MIGSVFRPLLAWPLGGRVESVMENVAGFIANARESGYDPRVVLALDSATIPNGMLACLHECEVLRSTTPDRVAFVNALPNDYDRDVILSFLVKTETNADPSYNRNAILLAAAGDMVISTDDDIRCESALLPDVSREVTYSHDAMPMNVAVHPDRASALASVLYERVDVVARHFTFLGKRGSDVVANLPEFARGGIVLTSPGTYGDSGFSRARGILSLPWGDRSVAISRGYDSCRLSREVVRIPSGPIISGSTHFMGMQSGYDARLLLPPFFPMDKCEDTLFGLMTRVLLPGSLTAYPAFGLYHDPIEPRAYDPATLTSFTPNRADIFMAFAARLCPPSSMTDPCERTIALGSRFREASGLSASDLVDLAHGGLANAALAHAERLEELLDRYGREPASWARDVDAHLENVYGFLRESATVFGPNGSARSISAVRSDLDRFGRFLSVWPELFERAKEMNREGRGIAQSLET